MVASCAPPTGDPARSPGMCPDWKSNQRPFALQSGAQSTEPQQPGPYSILSRAFVLTLFLEGRLLVAISLSVLILAEDDRAHFMGCAENYGIVRKALNPGQCSVKKSHRKSALSVSLLSLGAFVWPPQSWDGTEVPSSVTGPEGLLTAG